GSRTKNTVVESLGIIIISRVYRPDTGNTVNRAKIRYPEHIVVLVQGHVGQYGVTDKGVLDFVAIEGTVDDFAFLTRACVQLYVSRFPLRFTAFIIER